MSTALFPTLNGIRWPVKRTPEFRTRKQVSIGGQEVAIADMPYPRYTWELSYSVLRQGTNMYAAGDSFTEWATLHGFYKARNGGADSFLYLDTDDQTAPNDSPIQNMNSGGTTGDGTTTTFQLQRADPTGFVEPVYAPNVVANVKLNGVVQAGGSYTVLPWGTGNTNGPGVIVFGSAPGLGVSVTASFTYYWAVRFVEDKCEFTKFMGNRWRVDKLAFKSLLL